MQNLFFNKSYFFFEVLQHFKFNLTAEIAASILFSIFDEVLLECSLKYPKDLGIKNPVVQDLRILSHNSKSSAVTIVFFLRKKTKFCYQIFF